MTKKSYFDLIEKSSPKYLTLLLDDFTKNKKYVSLVNDILFCGINIEKWIKGTKIISVIQYISPSNKVELKDFNDIIENYHFEFENIDFSKCELNYIFNYIQFSSFEDAVAAKSKNYFIYRKDFAKKIDELVFLNLKDYSYTENGYFKKLVNNDVYLVFNTDSSFRGKISTISNYIFPEFSIQIGNSEYRFLSGTDIGKFLYFGSSTFSFFSMFSYHKIQENWILKNDEPIIIKENMSKFVLTNSDQNKAKYNKYIYLSIEAFIHYFRVFEIWIIKVLIPNIQEDNNKIK